jgi:hypothetical protein
LTCCCFTKANGIKGSHLICEDAKLDKGPKNTNYRKGTRYVRKVTRTFKDAVTPQAAVKKQDFVTQRGNLETEGGLLMTEIPTARSNGLATPDIPNPMEQAQTKNDRKQGQEFSDTEDE